MAKTAVTKDILIERSMLHTKEVNSIQRHRATSLLDAFQRVRYARQYCPHTFLITTDEEIMIEEYPTSFLKRCFSLDGKTWLDADKEVLTFLGPLTPIIEYLRWLGDIEGPKPDPSIPSLLPCLILFEVTGLLTPQEEEIMKAYGVSKDDAFLPGGHQKVKWLNIAAANELWLEVPGTTFANLIKTI